MIKVLKAGKPHARDPLYELRCTNCACEFECNRSDTAGSPDTRDVGIRVVDCPSCKTTIYFSEAKYQVVK